MSIRDWVADYNEEALLADGFDNALIGMCEVGGVLVVAYDREACIEILMEDFKDDLQDGEDLYTAALEYFDYNVAGAYVGETTPVFLTVYRP